MQNFLVIFREYGEATNAPLSVYITKADTVGDCEREIKKAILGHSLRCDIYTLTASTDLTTTFRRNLQSLGVHLKWEGAVGYQEPLEHHLDCAEHAITHCGYGKEFTEVLLEKALVRLQNWKDGLNSGVNLNPQKKEVEDIG